MQHGVVGNLLDPLGLGYLTVGSGARSFGPNGIKEFTTTAYIIQGTVPLMGYDVSSHWLDLSLSLRAAAVAAYVSGGIALL